ncbi:hypothetical protein M8J77_018801 [Diaphorina citri]|nr:hypothetical protein M8J77_018801 [Diaphorina citri]
MIAQQSQLASDIIYSDSVNARASPRDAQVPRLTSVSNGRGLPGQGRDRLKKIVQKEEIRIGSLNVSSMTGRGREVADLMRRRRIQILLYRKRDREETKPKNLEMDRN